MIATFSDLTKLSDAISQLSSTFGVNYNELVHLNQTLIPTRYKVPTECGEFWTEGVFKSTSIAIARSYASQDTQFTLHSHDECEIIHVEHGEIHLLANDEVTIYSSGQTVLLQPNVPHEAYFPVKSQLLCITIPASPTWPEVKKE
jgi:quercetin dioxygenase-like cupin family protein